MPFTNKTAVVAGRKSSRKGISNKTSKEIREAFNQLISSNINNLQTWLSIVGEKNPEKALEIIIKLSDFIIPKLSRSQIELDKKHEYQTPEEVDARIDELLRKRNK